MKRVRNFSCTYLVKVHHNIPSEYCRWIVDSFTPITLVNFNNNGIRKITTLIRVTISKHRLCTVE